MLTQRVLITYLVIIRAHPSDAKTPTGAHVCKKELELAGIDLSVKPDREWCYARILEAHPELENHMIVIWSVDVMFE